MFLTKFGADLRNLSFDLTFGDHYEMPGLTVTGRRGPSASLQDFVYGLFRDGFRLEFSDAPPFQRQLLKFHECHLLSKHYDDIAVLFDLSLLLKQNLLHYDGICLLHEGQKHERGSGFV